MRFDCLIEVSMAILTFVFFASSLPIAYTFGSFFFMSLHSQLMITSLLSTVVAPPPTRKSAMIHFAPLLPTLFLSAA